MNADGFAILKKLESGEPEARAELKRQIVLCASFARAERGAEEIALRVFCDTPVKKQEVAKDTPDALGVTAYLLRRLLLRKV